MVVLHVKRGEESLFLYETSIKMLTEDIVKEIACIYNGILKVNRIASEFEELINHGTSLPTNMVGLTPEQITELKLVDDVSAKHEPSAPWILNPDPLGRRNGHQASKPLQEVLKKAAKDAQAFISKNLLKENKYMSRERVNSALNELQGALMIVYPNGLARHDPIYMEFNNLEDLSGTQASLEIIEPEQAVLWFSNKQLIPDKPLSEAIGNNEKCKVIVKLARRNDPAPQRTAVISDETRAQLMAAAYKRQEELKKLEEDDDDQYYDSKWADNQHLKHTLHGLENIKFSPNK